MIDYLGCCPDLDEPISKMSLLEDRNLNNVSSPIRSTSLASNAYVLSLTSLSDCYAASASAPLNTIHLIDKSTTQHLQTLAGHTNGITTLRTVHRLGNSPGETLLSSGKDGVVKFWDTRSNSVVIQSVFRMNSFYPFTRLTAQGKHLSVYSVNIGQSTSTALLRCIP
jgi:WD40 repeat protein